MNTNYLDLPPLVSATGTICLPGSKSISNRALLLAALSTGKTCLEGVLASDDTQRMIDALLTLGISLYEDKEVLHRYWIEGCSGNIPIKQAELFLGNAGTAFRPLTAILSFSNGHYALNGSARMHERPIADLIDALQSLGGNIEYTGELSYPPLKIYPAKREDDISVVRVRGNTSSQFLTALLMSLPLLKRRIEVLVEGDLISKPYIAVTLKLMSVFGIKVEQKQAYKHFVIPDNKGYCSPGNWCIEPDASSASYFLAAGAIAGGPVTIKGLGANSIQGDISFTQVLAQLGAQVDVQQNSITIRSPADRKLAAFDLDLNAIPDAAMTLAVVALFTDGPCRLRNIESWRVKETDRIVAMAEQLRHLGADVQEMQDGLLIVPPHEMRPAIIETYDDHRMAMCFSLASFAGHYIRILDPKCVNKTFPTYFDCLQQIVTSVPVLTIDGPAASGKGTIAKIIAEQLGFHYLDSGALYRLLAWKMLSMGIDLGNMDTLIESISEQAKKMEIHFEYEHIFLDKKEVSEQIRSEQCGNLASKIAVYPQIREALLLKQRCFRTLPGLVADGRDMGTVVFPDAKLKIFLTASVESRAKRRYKQLIDKGISANITELKNELHERDERDSTRSISPLKKQHDALLLDTSDMTINQVVEFVRYHAQRASLTHSD